MVSNPFCLSPLESILILKYDLVVETIENGISLFQDLYLCLESLGLDITSVIFKSFQNGSNIPFFVISFYQRIVWMVDSYVIHFTFNLIKRVLPIPTKLTFQFYRIGSFRFIYLKYTYEVVPIYWSILTLDSCPWEINQYVLLEIHRVLFTWQHSQKWGFQWNRTNDVEPRALSFLYNIKKWWM